MKRLILAGSSLAAVAAAGSAGAVDVTLGGSIDMGWEYGVGKKADDANGFGITPGKQFQAVTLSLGVAGTTDAGLKFGGNVGLSTADDLKFNLYDEVAGDGNKHLVKLVNKDATASIKGKAYNVSGGAAITAKQIVSVKINSAWAEAATSITEHEISLASIATDGDICKIAGQGAQLDPLADAEDVFANRSANNAVDIGTEVAYLPAGQLTGGADADVTTVGLVQTQEGADIIELTAQDGTDKIRATNGDEDNAATAAEYQWKVGDASDDDQFAANAKVYAGPFMEVMMTSSTTKMVVGAVCVNNAFSKTSTVAYMDVASRVVHVSDASVYIEGGFGKLSLSTSKYGGSVGGVGSAGDQVSVGNTGIVASLSSVSFLGLSGSGAVDLGSVNLNGRPNYAFGTSVDLLGLTIAVEMEDEYVDTDTTKDGVQNTYIDKWDAATSYDLNGMSVAIATDSNKDWAMSLGYELMGFSMTSVVENQSKKANKKSGLSIDTTFSTSLNGVGISVSLDETLAWGIGASYSLGNNGLSLYANYSDADGGGKMGAKMSF